MVLSDAQDVPVELITRDELSAETRRQALRFLNELASGSPYLLEVVRTVAGSTEDPVVFREAVEQLLRARADDRALFDLLTSRLTQQKQATWLRTAVDFE